MTIKRDSQPVTEEALRLKKEFGFTGELVDIEVLAKILGKNRRAIWNLRDRGIMPPITEIMLGNKPHYWIKDIAHFLLTGGVQEAPPAETLEEKLKHAVPGETKKRGRRPVDDLAKQQLMDRAMELMALRKAQGKK